MQKRGGGGGDIDDDQGNEIDVENYAERNEIDGQEVIEGKNYGGNEINDQDAIENGIESQDENYVLESSDESIFLGFNSEEKEPMPPRKSFRIRPPRKFFIYHEVRGYPVIENQ